MVAVCWDIPTNAYGERPFFPVSAFDDGHFAAEEGAGAVEVLVGVAMVAAGVRVGVATVVGMGVIRHGRAVSIPSLGTDSERNLEVDGGATWWGQPPWWMVAQTFALQVRCRSSANGHRGFPEQFPPLPPRRRHMSINATMSGTTLLLLRAGYYYRLVAWARSYRNASHILGDTARATTSHATTALSLTYSDNAVAAADTAFTMLQTAGAFKFSKLK